MRIAACLIMLAAMLAHPQPCASAARDALCVWGLHVVPSLFPYMVFARLLAGQLRETRLSPTVAVLTLGLMGGSPAGASVLAGYAERLPQERLLALGALTGTISPMFIVGTLAAWGMLGPLCRALLLAHLLAALLSAFSVRFFFSGAPAARPAASSSAQGGAIAQSVQAILGVGGCIVFFSVVASLLELLLPAPEPAVRAALHAVLEIAGGMHALLAECPSSPILPVLAAALLGFGGLSILAQNALFLRPLGVGMGHLALFALLRAALSAACMAVFSVWMG